MMNAMTRLSILLAFVIVFASSSTVWSQDVLLPTPETPAADTNLVRNGDFSDGTNYWNTFDADIRVADGVMHVDPHSADSYLRSNRKHYQFQRNDILKVEFDMGNEASHTNAESVETLVAFIGGGLENDAICNWTLFQRSTRLHYVMYYKVPVDTEFEYFRLRVHDAEQTEDITLDNVWVGRVNQSGVSGTQCISSPELESVSVIKQDGETSSTSGVLDVRSNSGIVLRFDQAVSVSEDWFTVSCDDEVIAGITATTTSGDSATDNVEYTIGAPSDGYASGSACMLSIVGSRVVDADASEIMSSADNEFTLSSVADFEFTIYEPPELESVSVTLQDDSVSSTAGVLDVRSNSDIVLRFDQAVSVSGNWVTVRCDSDELITELTATTTSNGSATDNVVYTVTAPEEGYPSGAVCSVRIYEQLVLDADHDTVMASSFITPFEFTIYEPLALLGATVESK